MTVPAWDAPSRIPDPHLRRRLYPPSKASRNVRRIIRRMRYYGGGQPKTDDRGNRRPDTFVRIVHMVLQRRAKARKVRR